MELGKLNDTYVVEPVVDPVRCDDEEQRTDEVTVEQRGAEREEVTTRA